VISPYYDSLLAKLIAHGPDRPAAIATMAKALGDLEVAGVQTNAALLSALLHHERFVSAEITTGWLEEVLA
jgi:biotin carboxylase